MEKQLAALRLELDEVKHERAVNGKRAIDAEDQVVNWRDKYSALEDKYHEALAQIDSYEKQEKEEVMQEVVEAKIEELVEKVEEDERKIEEE